jgi:CRISPR-associated protein Cmr2
MATYLFSLGLLPVQEWIGQARRSRDLRAGSVVLSHLMAGLLLRLTEAGVRVRVPALLDRETLQKLARFRDALAVPYGIPHRASGTLDAADEDAVRALFAPLEREVVEATWQKLKDDYLLYTGSFRQSDDSGFWNAFEPELARLRAVPAAEDCPFSLVWAAMPAPYSEEDPERNLAAVDRLFQEVKRSRPYRVWGGGSAAGKCTQCARREAVGPAPGYDVWRAWHRRLEEQPSVLRGYRLDAGERLCAVCWTRRMAGYARGDQAFPSTGEVASAAWRERVRAVGLGSLLDAIGETELGRRDLGAALYLSPRLLRERGLDEAETLLARRNALREAIRDLPHASREPALASEPPGYLALLAFDGDDMGRRVRARPGSVPGAMADFARAAGGILARFSAAVFYLAGDEGLAMAPAASALALARELRTAFASAFATADPTATLSAGLAFFEHERPMAGAIAAARAVLAEAKRLPGDSGTPPQPPKNGLGVTVATASGSRWSFAAPWGRDWDRIERAVALVGEGRLASGWAYDAERFLLSLPEDAWRPSLLPAAEAEVRRLFFRRLTPPREERTASAKLAWKAAAWDQLPGPGWWTRGDGRAAAPCPEQLHLIGFLARQRPERPALGEEG